MEPKRRKDDCAGIEGPDTLLGDLSKDAHGGVKRQRCGGDVIPYPFMVGEKEALRLKEQPSSSLRDTMVTPPSGLYKSSGARSQSKESDKNGDRIDSYLLKLLSPAEMTKVISAGQAGSTGFKMPEPKVARHDSQGKSGAAGIQASNSLGKEKVKRGQWEYVDTQNVLGEDLTGALRNSVVQHQREYLEQLYDLHRAIAVQSLLVRHSNDQQMVVDSYQKEKEREKRAREKAGLGFETSTSLHKGLHPDSQFAAVPPSQDTNADGSGDDLTGSGDDVAGSGSGGNGKSGNGSGGGSTSHLNPPGGGPVIQGQVNATGMHRAPSGASNAPMFSWPTGHMLQMPLPTGGPAPWSQGLDGGNDAATGIYGQAGYPSQDPMMWWYQDYFNRYGNSLQQQQEKGQEHSKTVPSVFKWWQDPKLAFGAPADAKEVIAKTKAPVRREGGEVESAPAKSRGKTERIVAPPPKPMKRRRRRKPEDPVGEASSGTSGPAYHHQNSSDDVCNARSPKSRDANVAKLLLSISGKCMDGTTSA
ncbi:hypothetical protein PSENEW3_00003113 [Picochlorum sp. SENEW3]|nr:hypothetical protein PSENEW3_00003113 [Picochlorum sp. SENEW3]